jgi:hypothetical protein
MLMSCKSLQLVDHFGPCAELLFDIVDILDALIDTGLEMFLVDFERFLIALFQGDDEIAKLVIINATSL